MDGEELKGLMQSQKSSRPLDSALLLFVFLGFGPFQYPGKKTADSHTSLVKTLKSRSGHGDMRTQFEG